MTWIELFGCGWQPEIVTLTQTPRQLDDLTAKAAELCGVSVRSEKDPFFFYSLVMSADKTADKIYRLNIITKLLGLEQVGKVDLDKLPELESPTAHRDKFTNDSGLMVELYRNLTDWQNDQTEYKRQRLEQIMTQVFQQPCIGWDVTKVIFAVAPTQFLPLTIEIRKWLSNQLDIPDTIQHFTGDALFSIRATIQDRLMRIESKSKDMLEFIDEILNADEFDTVGIRHKQPGVYEIDDFLNEVFMTEQEHQYIKDVLERKKNIILQGPPGVGKTFAARRLCYSILGYKDPDRVRIVQFHQSTSYEDFVMGYRPDPESNKFTLQLGVFFTFCKEAEENPEDEYYFIIDEINRGNISKIFGELLMLIEADKRGEQIHMNYSSEMFAVPENIYIIGMMNTADRSLAVMDYALRRRFAFIDFKPGFETLGFMRYQKVLANSKFDDLVTAIRELNEDIRKDRVLGDGFMVGHSYLCNCKAVTKEWLTSVIKFDIIPLLKEYWFDDPAKFRKWEKRLWGILDD